MFVTLMSLIEQPLTMLAVFVAFISALFICMPFHEFAHAHAALKEGDLTSKALKRYTLAPFAHIDFMGLIMLLFFGIGYAKPVPVDSRNFKRGKKSSLRVALAGVLTNLLIGTITCFIFVLLSCVWPKLFYGYKFFSELYLYFFKFMISLNFMFAFFNLLPIYPLDGYRVVESLSGPNNKFLRFMRVYGFWIMLILLFSGLISVYISFFAEGLAVNIMRMFEYLINLFV